MEEKEQTLVPGSPKSPEQMVMTWVCWLTRTVITKCQTAWLVSEMYSVGLRSSFSRCASLAPFSLLFRWLASHHTLAGLFSVRMIPQDLLLFPSVVSNEALLDLDPHLRGLRIFNVSISKCSHIWGVGDQGLPQGTGGSERHNSTHNRSIRIFYFFLSQCQSCTCG